MRARCAKTLANLLAIAIVSVAVGVPTPQQIQQRLDAGDFPRAIVLVNEALEAQPKQPQLLYARASAEAMLGELDAAAESLLAAVQAGYRDFTAMQRDVHLRPLHEHETYQAILEASQQAVRELAQRSLDQWVEQFGDDGYIVEHDAQRRVIYATALGATAHREMREMLDRQADHLAQTLFEGTPDYDVFIAIPNPRHARQLFQQHNVGGSYEHRHRRLISRDVGGSLRHEFFHVMHYGHMERLGQPHRLWVQEGLASLYEDYELLPDGSVRFLPNERDEITRNRARVNRLIPWRNVFELPTDRFMARATVLYPQTRSMFQFVAHEGKLEAWYHAYVEHFDDDPTGEVAFEVAFDQPIRTIEDRWRQWVSQQPELPSSTIEPGQASLGIGTRPEGTNDGILITQILPGSSASSGELQVGDVLIAVDGQPTTSLNDLRRAMNSRRIGDEVLIRVRRGSEYATLPVKLKALGE